MVLLILVFRIVQLSKLFTYQNNLLMEGVLVSKDTLSTYPKAQLFVSRLQQLTNELHVIIIRKGWQIWERANLGIYPPGY